MNKYYILGRQRNTELLTVKSEERFSRLYNSQCGKFERK